MYPYREIRYTEYEFFKLHSLNSIYNYYKCKRSETNQPPPFRLRNTDLNYTACYQNSSDKHFIFSCQKMSIVRRYSSNKLDPF